MTKNQRNKSLVNETGVEDQAKSRSGEYQTDAKAVTKLAKS